MSRNVLERTAMILRRLRAVFAFAIIWAIAWAPVGLGLGLRHILINPRGIGSTVQFLSLFIVIGAVVGGICGTAFPISLLVLGRGKPFTQLAALPVALVAGSIGFLLGAKGDPGYAAAILFGALAAASAYGSLRIARPSAAHAAIRARATSYEA